MLPSVITGPVDLDLEPGELGAAVARRVAATLCAQAGLDLDRLSDASILAETLAAAGGDGDGDRLRIALTAGHRVVTISAGPLPDGGAGRLRARTGIPGIGSVVDRLPDTVTVRPVEGGEYLVMCFGEDGLPASAGGT